MTINDIQTLKENINIIPIDEILYLSVRYNYLDGVKLAINKNVDINIYDSLALRAAAFNNNFEIVKYLVEHGSNVFACNNESLYYAVNNENIELIKYLTNLGSTIETHIEENHKLKMILRTIKMNELL